MKLDCGLNEMVEIDCSDYFRFLMSAVCKLQSSTKLFTCTGVANGHGPS